jgi:hypothetical protein
MPGEEAAKECFAELRRNGRGDPSNLILAHMWVNLIMRQQCDDAENLEGNDLPNGRPVMSVNADPDFRNAIG